MVQLPRQELVAGAYDLADYGRRSDVSDPVAGGRCAIADLAGPVPDDELWLVDRIVVSCTSTTQTTALVYATTDGNVPGTPSQLRDGTPTGNLDTGDMASGLQLVPGELLGIVWQNVTGAGARGTAYAQWTRLRRS